MKCKVRRATPRPGWPARGSTTGRPIMALLDLLGRRWTLRVLWELRGGPMTFRALRTACGEISPTVLNTRLREMREAGIVAHEGEGFGLTAQGQSLLETIQPLHAWAERWAAQLKAAQG
jgi:DNA-binding HxlR family transcriptional regulator